VAKIEIPKQLWFVKRGDGDLAYVSYYEDNAACKKKQQTGRFWAGGSTQYERDPVNPYQYKLDENGKPIPIPKEPLKEEIVDNELSSGWKISDKAIRWSTSNVVWRITSPHGFEFEIYSGNMMEILKCSTIKNGEIMDKCVLAKGNVLLPETSDPYKEARKFTDIKAAKSGKPSDLKSGDNVVLHDGSEQLFLGKFYTLEKKETRTNNDKTFSFEWSDKPWYFFKNLASDSWNKDTIQRIKTPKILKITSPEEEDTTDYSIEINKKDRIIGTGYGWYIAAVSKEKTNEYEITSEYEPFSFLEENKTSQDPIVINNNFYLPHISRGYGYSDVAKYNCYNVIVNQQDVQFLDCLRQVNNNRGWGGAGYDTYNYTEVLTDDVANISILYININNQKIKLKSLIS
jgi:hypothetical protein